MKNSFFKIKEEITKHLPADLNVTCGSCGAFVRKVLVSSMETG